MKNFLAIFIFLSFILQFVSTLPLVLLSLVLATVFIKNFYIFLLAFFSGLILDLIFFKPLGFSSFFLIVCSFLILSYQSKFEIETNVFVFLATFVESFIYLLILGFNNVFLQSLLCAILAVFVFTFIKGKVISKGVLNYG